ncbi:MAG TPA: hypothetical protein VFJ16_03550 [Longimicrobium sp.]|nr:hypothetical protein [Longimicrobium sp.]
MTSAEDLDALMMLQGQPDRVWTCESLSQAIFSVPQSAALTLERLEGRGLAVPLGGEPPAWRYAAAGEKASPAGELAAAYRANRASVIKHLFAQRVDPVRSLADAFRIRKDR